MEQNKYIHTTDVHNTLAAEEIVPVLMEWFNQKSVVDVGCGLGTWLFVFKSHGVQEILGIDGTHLDTEIIVIDHKELLLTDLEQPFGDLRKFDLALSLEVAEHLSDASSDLFVESLTKLSDIIIFSAAIPNQGGQNHINEQWIGYWQSKFAKHHFIFTDEIRPLFWNNEKIEWWYKQNMVIAIKEGTPFPFSTIRPPLDLVHPDLFEMKNKSINDLYGMYYSNMSHIGELTKQLELLETENSMLKAKLDKNEKDV